MASHRRNHVVQKGYLNLFARDERIVSHFVGSDVTKEISTNDAAVRKNFYVTTWPDGTRSTGLETAINKLETPVPSILRRIERDWPLDEKDRSTLTEYLALQAVRSPAWDRQYRDMTTTWLREKREHYDCSDEQWANLEAHVTSDAYRHESMIENQNKSTALVGSMQWTLLTFSNERLVTSDHPLVVVSSENGAPPGAIPKGGMTEAVEFIFPVGPRRALLLTWMDGIDEVQPRHCNARVASAINAHLLANAQRQWFTIPDSTPAPPLDGSVGPISYLLYEGSYSLEVAAHSERRRQVLAIINEWIESNEKKASIPIIRALPTYQ